MLLLYGTDNSLQISNKLQMASKIAALRGVAGQWQQPEDWGWIPSRTTTGGEGGRGVGKGRKENTHFH